MPLRRPSEPLPGGPLTALSALVLFAVVTVLRFAVEDPGESVAILYVVPIALVAVRFGLVAGLALAALGLALFAMWDAVKDAGIGPVGYLVRFAAFFLVAGLAGGLTERLRASERRAARLEGAEELNSAVVQRLAVARLALERGDVEGARAAVSETLAHAAEELGERLPDDPRPGDFVVPEEGTR